MSGRRFKKNGVAMSCALLLVGCGKMGGALLEGWLKSDAVERVVVVEPGSLSTCAERSRLLHCQTASAVPSRFQPDVVVFAVKPQVMGCVLPDYQRYVRLETVFLSIAAGRTLDWMRGQLGVPESRWVRAMPNTPAAVGRGMTVAIAGEGVSETQIEQCESLLRAVGDVAWLTQEALIDPCTAVSGSGPAYVFLLIEALAQAGVRAGLPEDLAMRLARATVAGAGELVYRSIESASQLRYNVTSPGGTTQAALSVLMAKDGLQPLFDQAVAAAAIRSCELAKL
ncbi:Pyrroline-5-carboxylate reductase [Azospirillaceae bacterium]